MRVFWSGPLPAEGARCLRSFGSWQRKASASDPVDWLQGCGCCGSDRNSGLAASLLLLCERTELSPPRIVQAPCTPSLK